ncbi:ABC-2 transporter permease [Shouchella clausii]|jgi:ABC-2 type transport system permease protein|uniref:ABC-2 transporter permease n=1 Tax=Shouchella clausii TaxID=79880 RepID=UPI000B96CF63|nr:ABC-2 transporter permease [Shouchella clausii]AST95399.1 multidrug ABC transporter permease [Shouchella clausii]MEB5471970.1 ABC-2 transporter permease [Shouchella clausii]QNM41753.1 ABC-2 transporter permease [Shouchella clausii]WQG95428.1 ABC-2 transporter permease [Shouchella clausii]
MFNLIKRDLILQKRQLIVYLPFILFFIIMDAHPVLIFLVASIFIPFNTHAYDEKAETNILLNSLPYTRTEIIASRYIGAIVYMGLAIVITSLALFVFNKPFTMADIAMGSGLFLLFVSFTFPLFYIFKPGFISIVVLISFFLFVGIGPSIVISLAEQLSAVTDFVVHLSVPALYSGAALIILAVYVLSWGITHVIYQRKVF